MFRPRKSQSIGVDIGSSAVRLVKLTGSADKPVLSLIGSISLPKGAVSGGEIIDSQAVAEAVQNLVKRIGLKDKNVVLGVGNQRVVVRFIDIPYIEEKELANAIRFQAQDFVPIPVEDAILDYQVVGDYFNEEGERFLQVMLIAAHKGMISMLIDAVERGGLKPEIIDVNAFAVVRALARAKSLSEGAALPESHQPGIETTGFAEEENFKSDDAGETDLQGEQKESLTPSDAGSAENSGSLEVVVDEFDNSKENLFSTDQTYPGGQEARITGNVSVMEEQPEPEPENNLKNVQIEQDNGLKEIDESAFFDEDDTGPPGIADGAGLTEAGEDQKEVVAFVDIGAEITNLCVVEDEAVRFVRLIGIGGNDWTQAIVEFLGESYDEAEELKIKVGLPPLTGDRYLDVPGEYLDKAERVFSILEREVIRFIGELRRSFEYYVSQSGGNRITRVIFSGGASSLKNLASYLEKGLDVVVERIDPFAGITVPPRLKEQLKAEDRGSFTIAVGLALRGFES